MPRGSESLLEMRFSSILQIALWGAIGGTINALLCYLKLPVPVPEFGDRFNWYVILAGAAHGGLLAFITVGVASFLISAEEYCKVDRASYDRLSFWIRFLGSS